MSASIVWLIILAVMIIIEIATLGLTTIWFGIGAIGAAVVSGLGYGIWGQLGVFAVLSVIEMATGEVTLNGMDWTARSEDGSVIEEGKRVTVVSVQGVKLIVK